MRSDTIAALTSDDLERIAHLLRDFVQEATARCALLLDRGGRPLAAFGDIDGIDQAGFASLAAADFEASDQLARLLGEREFGTLHHQGVHGSVYLSDVAGIAILAAVFDRPASLGMIRPGARDEVRRLCDLLAGLEARPPRMESIDARWSDAAVSQIDRLFAG